MRKLVWTEGLFITQHHFQQMDRYHELLVFERMRAAFPYDWGVTELSIDERSLASNQFRISNLHAVLPDGTPIRCEEGKRDAIQPRSFAAEFLPNMLSLDVYIALVQEAEGASNVDLDGSQARVARYGRAQEKVADKNTGSDEQTVDCAVPLVRVVFGDEVKGLFDAIRVARLVRSPSGAVQLASAHVPPVLRVGASGYLMGQLRMVLTVMSSRQRSLAMGRRQRSAGSVEVEAPDMLRFLFLDLLNGLIPSFSHMVDTSHAHPEELYKLLGGMIGRLCSFSDQADPSSIPPYNHQELGWAFEPMFNLAANLLNSIISDRYTEIPLQRREDGVYVGKATPKDILQSTFYLAVSGTLPEAQIRERLPKLLKVASLTHISPILKSAVTGAQLELEYRPPSALPLKPGISFFRITKNPPEFWADIANTRSFAFYHPFDPQSLNLSLYAVETSNES